ncbi:hypothetical protein ACUTAH_02675 [Metapseudomonas furukawaii]|uniref:hypothetical protein n=1 Tax=Metapseudomonas furukawaii TaxID=1149133 RepID=UPI0040464FF4
MQCPACNHIPQPGESQDPARCPACGVYYHKVLAKKLKDLETAKPAPESFDKRKIEPDKKSLSILGKVVIAAFVAVFLVGGTAVGWLKYSEHQNLLAAKPAIKITSAYLSQMATYHASDSNITFGEYFDKAKIAIDEIDKKLIELNSLDLRYAKDDLSLAAEYMRQARELIRDMSALMRASMNASSASEQADRLRDERYESDNEYIQAYAEKGYAKALDEQKEALEKFKKLMGSMESRTKSIVELNRQVSDKFGPDAALTLNDVERLTNR